MTDDSPVGVNVVGHAFSETGIGEALRSSVRALEGAGVPHVVVDLPDPRSPHTDRTLEGRTGRHTFPVNLLHVNAHSLPGLVAAHGYGAMRDRYNVGFWMWETPEFPQSRRRFFDYVDEVWVPSGFCRDAVARSSPVPVLSMLHALKPPESEPGPPRETLGLPRSAFVYLFAFDVQSLVERKNPFALIRAFRQAVRRGDDAILVLKLLNASPHLATELREAAGDARLIVIDRLMTRPELNALLSACDCYVSLHRAEGFGLTLAEAMARGKPVIATGYSGNIEFMTEDNSFPVRYELTTLDRNIDPFLRGSVWAEPDIPHAAALMRQVFDDRTTAAAVGRRGRADVARLLSPEAVGAMMASRLDAIAVRVASDVELRRRWRERDLRLGASWAARLTGRLSR
jgi:glycosyltransferase involved in cell wall biosynthesis